MSITQTYFLAHTARGKLAKEASRADHDLRLLVGHANLLDELMLDLANAEQEQENWFNRTVSGAKAAEEEQKAAKHIQWAETVVEEPEEDWDVEDADSDSDDDSDDDEEMDEPMTATPIAMAKASVTSTISTRELTDEYDEDEDLEELALTRTESHHPPELTTSDSDDESEDDSMPPSPPSTTLQFTEKERQSIATTSYYDKTSDAQLSEAQQSHFLEDGFFIPPREQPAMIPAY